MERVADLQRLIGYLIGWWAVASWLRLDDRRTAALGTLVLVAVALSAGRLVERSYQLRYQAAVVDLAIAPLIAGVASNSVPVVVATTLAVAIALLAMFERRALLTGVAAVISLAIALGVMAHLNDVEPVVAASDTRGWQSIVAITLIGLTLVFASMSLWWQAQFQLSESKADLMAVLHATPVVVGRVDVSGTVRYVAGDTRDVIEPALLGGRLPPELLDAVLTADDTKEVELSGRTFSVASIVQPNGDHVFTAYDISEIAGSKRELEVLIRSKDELVASISHELRTPLTSVLGFALELRDRLALDDEHDELVGLLASESEEMASIIEDLLVAARADLGTLAIRREGVDLADIAEWSADALTAVQPAVEAGAALVEADPIRLRQIIRNLLTNAARYGGPEVVVRSGVTGATAFVEVADVGARIDLARAQSIFEPYVSTGVTSSQPNAIGLGLPVSRELARLMGGKLEYRHSDGWNVFRLELPVANTAVQRIAG